MSALNAGRFPRSGYVTRSSSSGLADTAAVDRMVCAVVPRGPDGQGTWSTGRVAFGAARKFARP